MPARLRGAAFCTRGQTRPMGRGATSGARGLQGGAARGAQHHGGGVLPPGPAARKEESAERPVRPVRPRRRGRRSHTHPTPHASKLSAGRGGPAASAGAARGRPRPRTGVPAGRAPRRPPRPRTRRGLTGPAPRRRPPAALARRRPSPALGESDEEASAGRALRKARVTWGVAGGWAAFRAGGRESGRGRGVRAQRKRGGGGRPRARQVAGWPRKCRRTGGSSGGSGDCSCSSLRIFLGQVQDGGAACTGFPVTLAMGRTTKEGGRRMRAQLAEPGKR